MMPFSPLGTLYAASVLRNEGYQVEVFDSMLAESEEEIRAHITRHRPRIVVIYDDDFNYLTKMCLTRMREAAFKMSMLAREMGCTVIVHGSDATDHIESYLSHGADYVVIGEGEQTLLQIVSALSEARPDTISTIEGLGCRLEDGRVHRTPKRSVLNDLDSLPFPARDLIDTEMYRKLWKRHHGYFSMNIVTTRGCPFHCNWCAKPIYGQVYNSRSPENVVEEMVMLKQDFRPDQLWFCDDIFGLKPGWVPRFAEAVRRRDASIPFKCLARVDLLLKENTIQHLANAGCRTIWVGAESGSQKILDAMDKGTTVEQIYTASRIMRQHGIRIGYFLQFGYPGETLEDINLTFNMLRECRPDEIGISVSYPLPGTKFYNNVKQQMVGKQNWTDSEDLAMMFAGTYHQGFYRVLHKLTHKKLRIWQGVDKLRSIVKNPTLLDFSSMRSLAAGAYHRMTLPRFERELDRLSRISTAS